MKSDQKLAAEIKAARTAAELAADAERCADDMAREAESAYTEAVTPRVKEALSTLTWKWPGKRGERKALATVKESHALTHLLTPLFDGQSELRHVVRIQVGNDWQDSVTFRCDCSYSDNKYTVTMPLKVAKLLGIRNPVAKQDWRAIKKRLEAAGITDDGKLQELLDKEGTEE